MSLYRQDHLKIISAHDTVNRVIWTHDGFMNVTEGNTLNFQLKDISRSMQYQFFLRYLPKVSPSKIDTSENQLESI